jgi:CNT family concentrative nucleoside transporter
MGCRVKTGNDEHTGASLWELGLDPERRDGKAGGGRYTRHQAILGAGMQTAQSLFGIVGLLAIAWLVSENRTAVSWRRVGAGLALTLATALIFLKVPGAAAGFAAVNDAVDAIAAATRAGTSFVFGYVGGAALPFELKVPGADFSLAFQALPVVLVMSVLTTLLFYWRILPPIVRGFALLLERTLGVGGAVGLSTAANIFLGMVEAPLFIRPYLASLTRGELFIVMTGGMAGIAGTVLVIYAGLLGPIIPGAAGHLVVASVLGAPAAIVISLIMVPDPLGARTGGLPAELAPVASSTMDAIVKGTAAGLELLLNICAMLIVLVALVHLANALLGLLPDMMGAPITLQRMLGMVMAPVCWLMGIPWSQAPAAGALMGIKTVLNEFLAYAELARLPSDALDARSRLIMLYAMCGFANFGSLGIMIGGLATMAPGRRDDIVSLGLKSIVSGTLSTCLIGALVGLLDW